MSLVVHGVLGDNREAHGALVNIREVVGGPQVIEKPAPADLEVVGNPEVVGEPALSTSRTYTEAKGSMPEARGAGRRIRHSLRGQNPSEGACKPRPREAARSQGVHDGREGDTCPRQRGSNSLCPRPWQPEAKGSMPETRGAGRRIRHTLKEACRGQNPSEGARKPRPRKAARSQGVRDGREGDTRPRQRGSNSLCPRSWQPEAKGSMPEARRAGRRIRHTLKRSPRRSQKPRLRRP